jgi:hypothetical protein
VPCATPDARPKLAFVADDVWEVTVNPNQISEVNKQVKK